MRAIDADTLLKKVEKILPWAPYPSAYAQGVRWCMELVGIHIKNAPAIEPERRRGQWEIYAISPFDGEGCKCSVCGFYDGAPYYNFCPNCGADMREEQE